MTTPATPDRPPRRARLLRLADAALVAGSIALYLAWLARHDLFTGLPGGPALPLALAAAVVLIAGTARLALGGQFGRARAALRAAPHLAALAGLLLLAAVPRFAAPPALYPDFAAGAAVERATLDEAHRILTSGDYRPRAFARPSLYLYLQTAAGGLTFLAGVSADRWRDLGAFRPADLAPGARALNAALSLLTVALVYTTGAALYRRRAGLLAAALLAASPLAWAAARVATEDALVALVALAAMFQCGVRSAECGIGDDAGGKSPAVRRDIPHSAFRTPHFVAALLVGVAAGVRPSLALLTIPLIIALWPRPASFVVPFASLRAGHRSSLPLLRLGQIVAFLLLGYLLVVPYAIAELPALLDAGAVAAREYELRARPATLVFFARHVPDALALLARVDPLLALAGGLGALRALLARRRPDLLLLSFLIPAAILLVLRRDLDPRPLVAYGPFLALLGGRLLDDGLALLTARRRPRRRAPRAPRPTSPPAQ